MSGNAEPSKEAQIVQVLRNLLTTQYGLTQDDQQRALRLIRYSQEKLGLTETEKQILIKAKMMDDRDYTLNVPNELMFQGTVTPAFFLKCLMALDGMITFGEQEIEETPSK